MRTGAESNDDSRLLPDLSEAFLIFLPRARTLDKGNEVILALFGHRFAELDYLHRLDQFQVGLQGINDGELAALAAGKVKKRNLWLSVLTHYSASSNPLMSAYLKTGPSWQQYRSLIWQWPHLPTPHFIRRSNDR